MNALETTRQQLDKIIILISTKPNYANEIKINPDQALANSGILEKSDLIPLCSWNPVPSAITACPTCLLRPTPANPHTSADCPPRPNPNPSPSPRPPR